MTTRTPCLDLVHGVDTRREVVPGLQFRELLDRLRWLRRQSLHTRTLIWWRVRSVRMRARFVERYSVVAQSNSGLGRGMSRHRGMKRHGMRGAVKHGIRAVSEVGALESKGITARVVAGKCATGAVCGSKVAATEVTAS